MLSKYYSAASETDLPWLYYLTCEAPARPVVPHSVDALADRRSERFRTANLVSWYYGNFQGQQHTSSIGDYSSILDTCMVLASLALGCVETINEWESVTKHDLDPD